MHRIESKMENIKIISSLYSLANRFLLKNKNTTQTRKQAHHRDKQKTGKG